MRKFLMIFCIFIPLPSYSRDVNWICWYDKNIYINCFLDKIEEVDTTNINLPINIPTIVKQIRENPSYFKGNVIQIPLYTIPYDMDFVSLLAKSTMCGSRKDCLVNFIQK